MMSGFFRKSSTLSSQTVSSKRGWSWANALALLVMIAALAGWTTAASAFESYHDPNTNDTGYCTTCHPGFAGGRSDTLHALHTGGTSALGTITSNCDLCHTTRRWTPG